MGELEDKRIEAEVAGEDTAPDYIAAIQQLKENSVDKATYEKVKAENKRLTQALINGDRVKVEKPKVDFEQLRKDACSPDVTMSDLDKTKAKLLYREEYIKRFGIDPLLPRDPNGRSTATQRDVEEVHFLVDTLQELVDYADGDPGLFKAEFNRRLQEGNQYKRY